MFQHEGSDEAEAENGFFWSYMLASGLSLLKKGHLWAESQQISLKKAPHTTHTIHISGHLHHVYEFLYPIPYLLKTNIDTDKEKS